MNRMKTVFPLIIFLIASVSYGGFNITEENDCFFFPKPKDNSYTQGAELSVDTYNRGTNGTIVSRDFYGIRSRMYTPDEIENPDDQPKDRPWADSTAVFFERLHKEGSETCRYGVELGVLGPDAGGEWQQTTIHKLLGCTTPKGWSNQVPDQLDAQVYMLRYHPLLNVGTPSEFSALLELPYGANIGTVYDYLQAGLSTKVGWNIPPLFTEEGIAPKVFLPKPFIYLFANANYMNVLENATLGHSPVVDKGPQWDRPIDHNVGEFKAGASAGWKGFAMTYFLGYRTEEWKGQPEPTYWGTISLSFTQMF